MKTFTHILLLVGLIFTVASCNKEILPNPDPETMDELVVKPDFDWKTTVDYEITITGSSNRVVTIAAADGTVYKKGMVTQQVPLTCKLTLPAYTTSVHIKYSGQDIELALSAPTLSYVFN